MGERISSTSASRRRSMGSSSHFTLSLMLRALAVPTSVVAISRPPTANCRASLARFPLRWRQCSEARAQIANDGRRRMPGGRAFLGQEIHGEGRGVDDAGVVRFQVGEQLHERDVVKAVVAIRLHSVERDLSRTFLKTRSGRPVMPMRRTLPCCLSFCRAGMVSPTICDTVANSTSWH